MTPEFPKGCTPAMPKEEGQYLYEAYQCADMILEYGAGSSTKLACSMPNKKVISVESDKEWADQLEVELEQMPVRSLYKINYVDIGETGEWGRPVNESSWTSFSRYPNDVWHDPFLQQPDVILIDGRFRTACLVSAGFHAQKEIRVLFDDYETRPKYHVVEEIFPKNKVIGRMAEFIVEPNMIKQDKVALAISQYFSFTTTQKLNYKI